jgi:acyl carrier protein
MDSLIEFLTTLSDERKYVICAQTELIESGIVDSLNIVKLLAFIEEKTGRAISLEDMDLDDLKSADRIMSVYFADEGVQ